MTTFSSLEIKRVATAFMSTSFCLLAFNGERHDVQFRVDFIPNCLLLFTWDALISKYHQIWSQHSLFSPLSVGITVATVKTNLIIIRVMFFGISVHLPANFDGLCPDYAPLTLSSTYFVPKCGARLCHYPGCPAWDQTEAQARYHPQPFTRKSILVGTESYLMTLMTGSCNNQR